MTSAKDKRFFIPLEVRTYDGVWIARSAIGKMLKWKVNVGDGEADDGPFSRTKFGFPQLGPFWFTAIVVLLILSASDSLLSLLAAGKSAVSGNFIGSGIDGVTDFKVGASAPCAGACYHFGMFNFGKPKTAGDWIVHIAGAVVALLLVWWMLRMYVL